MYIWDMLILKNYLLSILTRQPVYYLATLVTGNFSFLFFGSLMGWKIKWSRNHMFCRQSGTSSVLVQALENNSCLKESSFSSTHICEYLCFLGLVRGAKYTKVSRGGQGRVGNLHLMMWDLLCQVSVGSTVGTLGGIVNSAGHLQSGSEMTNSFDRPVLE